MSRATVVLVACVALSACTAASPPPSPTPTPTVTTEASFADLEAVLFAEAPTGYVAVQDETRGLVIDDIVAGADDPEAERDRLNRHGFRRGFIRTWTSDDDSENVVYAFVYEFADAAGARADADEGIEEARRDGDTFFAVPGVEGARGVTKKPKPGTEGDESTFHAVVFVRGNRYFLVAVGGPSDHPVEEAISLARAMDAAARR